jgi:hypothetical protein
MRASPLLAKLSRRAVRVALLTMVLTVVACECDENHPLKNCLPGIEDSMPCMINTPSSVICLKVDYVVTNAECRSCSDTRCMRKSMNVVNSGFDTTCVGGDCGLVCGTGRCN